jgi:hypothetical protein
MTYIMVWRKTKNGGIGVFMADALEAVDGG